MSKLRFYRQGSAAALAAAALSVLLLTACGQSVPSTPGATDAPVSGGTGDGSDSEAETPPTSAYTGALVIPDCAQLNPVAESLAESFSEAATGGVTAPRGATDLAAFNDTVGPIARTAMASTTRRVGCTWPVSYHDVIEQHVAQLSEAQLDTLIAGLRDSDYRESALRGHPRFDYRVDHGNGFAVSITYVFVADAWVAIFGGYDESVVSSAYDVLLANNPGIELVGVAVN